MHPLAGTKRGGAFATHENEEQKSINSSKQINSLNKAREILAAHYRIREPLSGLSGAVSWKDLPEIPSSDEILNTINSSKLNNSSPEKLNDYQKDTVQGPELPSNIIDGPWPSKEAYITAHYKILREDAISSLRHAVQKFKRDPSMLEDETVYIYTEVTITGWLLSQVGPACRVEFCTDRADKRIRWEHSKRLMQGTLVALTSYSDMFQTYCNTAIVGGRPIQGGLDQNPPTIDLFFGDIEKVELDPHEKFIMIEARDGYFEASRHMLVSMQKLIHEKFPLSKHLAFLDKTIEAPEYLKDQPNLNLSSLLEIHDEDVSRNVSFGKRKSGAFNFNVLENFPKDVENGMDESQIHALQSIITKQLAIVQGPPGTGKTFVSTSALKVMAQNQGPGDPPIIVAAQTNHALDQLLNHILEFEPSIVRIGGQSARSNQKIHERTIYNLSVANHFPGSNAGMGKLLRELKFLENQIRVILAPLLTENILTSEQLLEFKIITEEQHKSLLATTWAKDEDLDSEIATWLGDDQRMAIKRASTINIDFPLEDIENEPWRDCVDAEQDLDDPQEGDYGALSGEWLPYRRRYTGRHLDPIVPKKWKKRLSKIKDLYEIQESERGLVYRYFEMRVDANMKKNLKVALKKYKVLVNEIRIAKAVRNIKLLGHLRTKIVGCTTSGLSKYRGLLSALQPRIILIEEAAETLEGKIIAGTPESIQHIIMVGDHKQLQASCTNRALLEAPYNMKVSMFERLVNNNLPYMSLTKQRRMISDIRKLLCVSPTPFYKNLHDHEIVLDRINARPPVPGMGGKDTYFFNHNWPEARDPEGSCYNEDEAEMVVAFFHYLHLNHVEPSKITILTFYNGQKKHLLRFLKCHNGLLNVRYFNVQTIDSYQGEENDIILLSLVRSNETQSIGFLENKNRFVVALSRAKRGLYIFGNSVTLTAKEYKVPFQGRELLWLPLLRFMRSQARFDINTGLPVTCVRHGTVTLINEAKDFAELAGGCKLKCDRGPLPCHHTCPLNCHAFEHEMVACCKEPCPKNYICGHRCSRTCGAECFCDKCGPEVLFQMENVDDDPSSSYNRSKNLPEDLSENDLYGLNLDITDSKTSQTTPHTFQSRKGSSNCKIRQRYVPSGNEGINSRSTSTHHISSTKNETWNSWDSRIADQRNIEKMEIIKPKKQLKSYTIFNESYRNITVQDGMRFVHNTEKKPVQSIVEFDNDSRNNKAISTRLLQLEYCMPTNSQEIAQEERNISRTNVVMGAKILDFSNDKDFPCVAMNEKKIDSENLIDLTESIDLIEL